MKSSRARSVHFDATSPAIVYSGTRHRGRRSADGGATWADMGHPQEAVGTFATTAGDPGVVWSAAHNLDRSADSGVTWADGSGGAFCCFQEVDVVVHPGDPLTVYAAGYGSGSAADGVYKTTDGGATWNPMNSGLGDRRIRMLAVDLNDGDTVYAAVADDGPGNAAVYKTTDGAASWFQLGGGLPGDFHPNQIAVHPLDSNLLHLAAEGPQSGLYRSTDGGASWQLLLSDNGTTVAVDPGDPNRLYFGTWNTSGFWRTLDGGATWALINEGLPVHPGIESIAVDPGNSQHLLMNTSGGVYEIDFGAGTVTMTVTISDDSGPGSLRDALIQANQDGVPNRIEIAPWLAGAAVDLQSSLPGLEFPARLVEFSTTADPATRTFQARLQFDTPTDQNILPGMTARVIYNAILNGTTTLPSTAAFSDASGNANVWIVDPDSMQVSRRAVTLGELTGGDVEIRSGLDAGDLVAVSGVSQLREGMQVRRYDN